MGALTVAGGSVWLAWACWSSWWASLAAADFRGMGNWEGRQLCLSPAWFA